MKRGLLSMIVAALTFVGALTASAQGWTAVSVQAGNFNLYNVGTAQFFTRGNGWGTQASITSDGKQSSGMTLEFIAVGDNWFLRSGVNGTNYGIEHLDGGTVYTDQSRNKQSTWNFVQVSSNQNGPIYNIVSVDNHGGGAGAYLTAGVDGTIVTPGADGTVAGAQWQVVKAKTAQDYIDDANAAKAAALAAMANATPTSPVDVTALIFNANFDNQYLQSYWTMEANNYNPQGGSAANPCAESWQAAFTLSQRLTGLPEGTYVLQAQAAITDYTNAYDGANYPVIYANEVTSPFIDMVEADRGTSMTQLSGSFSNGMYEVAPLTVIVGEDGVLTVGAKGTRTNTWCIWDNFRLTFYGFDQNALVAAYKTSLAQAIAIDGKMSAAAEEALAAAIQQYSSIDETSKEAVRAAKNALDAAVAAATQSVADYAEIAAFIEKYQSYQGINTLAANYEAGSFGTLADFYPEAQATILASVGTRDGVDITPVILNPTPTANSDFWTGSKSNAYDPGNNVAEFWNMSGASMSQTLPQLPEGTYFLSVKAFTRTGFTATLSTSTGASINLVTVDASVVNNRGQANEWFNAGNGDNTLAFNVVGAPQDVTITLTADNANGDHWMVWRNFTLEYNLLKDLVFTSFGTTTFKFADGTAVATTSGADAGLTPAYKAPAKAPAVNSNVNTAKIKDGIIISFPGNDIKNVPIHPSHYQALGKIENKTDGITYIVRSNGYYDNGYNPDFDIHFGQGLFGWSNSALDDYIAAANADISKKKEYEVTINKIVFIDQEMDAVDMKTGYEVNVLPMPFLWGTYAVPDTKDMTAEDYIDENGDQYIWNMFVEYYTEKHGAAPATSANNLPEQDVDYYLELQRYRKGWAPGDAYIDPATYESTYPVINPYRALTADEEEYIRFFLATYCEGVIIEKDQNVPYTFTINTTADVKQDAEKIERDQKVTAWDVRGNQVTDLLFEPSIATSIEGIQVSGENGSIYNLAGQRVQTARKGIYVIGGKKVVLK